MSGSRIIKEFNRESIKKVLNEVDDLILKKKTTKNPEKLLKKQTDDVTIGDKKLKIKDKKLETEIGVKDFKKKVPTTTKESVEEFLASFGNNKVSKKVLSDFNIDKISSNEDIIKMMNLIAKTADKKAIVKQTRGVQAQGTTKAVGSRLMKDNDFVVNILNTKAGQTYNAQQIYAIRQLFEAGMSRLDYLAKKAVDPDLARDIDVLRFRQHYALMAQIHKVLLGVRTETGRALNQFKIPTNASKKYSFVGGNVDSLNRQTLLVELGGADEIKQIAKLYLKAPPNTIAKINAVNKTGLQKVSDGFAEIFLNAILSNPLTHVRNATGNWVSQGLVLAERRLAANSRKFAGTGSGINYIAPYEDVAKVYGKYMAAQEIMAAMKNVYKLGGSKIEQQVGNITAQNFNIKSKGWASFVDIVGKGITLNNYPTRWLKTADDYLKLMNLDQKFTLSHTQKVWRCFKKDC